MYVCMCIYGPNTVLGVLAYSLMYICVYMALIQYWGVLAYSLMYVYMCIYGPNTVLGGTGILPDVCMYGPNTVLGGTSILPDVCMYVYIWP